MQPHRLSVVILVTAFVALTTVSPAGAHGATTKPISRTAACAAQGAERDSAACRAALKANGQPFGTFDNLRVAGVSGRDREVIPDGELCSGGLAQFKGLDLARDDWPATEADAGDTLDVRYAAPIPHRGSFRIYLTEQGYDPGERLRWSDLGGKPIDVVKDPPLRDGAYRMTATLPADRSGRHVLFVVWETSSTPDTYYSCSDLDIEAPPPPAPKRTKAAVVVPEVVPKKVKSEPEPTAEPTVEPTVDPAPSATPRPIEHLAGEKPDDQGRIMLAGALLVVAAMTGGLAIARIRRGRRAQDLPREPENR